MKRFFLKPENEYEFLSRLMERGIDIPVQATPFELEEPVEVCWHSRHDDTAVRLECRVRARTIGNKETTPTSIRVRVADAARNEARMRLDDMR